MIYILSFSSCIHVIGHDPHIFQGQIFALIELYRIGSYTHRVLLVNESVINIGKASGHVLN